MVTTRSLRENFVYWGIRSRDGHHLQVDALCTHRLRRNPRRVPESLFAGEFCSGPDHSAGRLGGTFGSIITTSTAEGSKSEARGRLESFATCCTFDRYCSAEGGWIHLRRKFSKGLSRAALCCFQDNCASFFGAHGDVCHKDHRNMKTALIAFVTLGIPAGFGPWARRR